MGEDTPIQAEAKQLREDLKAINKKLWEFKTKCIQDDSLDGVFKGEAIANATLAYRHGEDARMRLGKVLQATGSVNPYDA